MIIRSNYPDKENSTLVSSRKQVGKIKHLRERYNESNSLCCLVLRSFPNKIVFHLSNRLVNMSHLMTFNLMLNEVENAAISDFPFGVFKPLTNPVSVSSNGWLTAICDEEIYGLFTTLYVIHFWHDSWHIWYSFYVYSVCVLTIVDYKVIMIS